ncbi:MAG: hypothetical protein SF052_14495 [Bacteroidia bacterium]|nr:hypothetical protein [Bacteroidia bacterium]
MTEIRYTLLAEGYAELGFIPEILRQIGGDKYIWRKSNLNIPKPSNRARVLAKLEVFSETSLLRNKEDLFIAGIDLDQQETEKEMPLWNKERKMIQEKLSTKIPSDKVVIFIPIQAIDYWLLYLHDPQLAANSAESKTRGEVKKLVYGKRNDGNSMQKTAKSLAVKPGVIDILSKKSRSFACFAEEVKTFLKAPKT